MSALRRTDGRRLRPHGPRARLRGVGQRRSTDEALEQGPQTVCGECGGKAAGQGEHPLASHAPDTERGFSACPRGHRVCGERPSALRYSSATRAVCANERSYGSVRGVPGNRYPYRDSNYAMWRYNIAATWRGHSVFWGSAQSLITRPRREKASPY